MGTRYRALTIIGQIYKGIAVLVFAGAVLAAIATIASSSGYNSYYGYSYGLSISTFLIAGGALLGGTLSALGIYAVGEFISLLIEIAFNTRNTEASTRMMNTAMQQQLRMQPPATGMPMKEKRGETW